jgi:hypothetical protein
MTKKGGARKNEHMRHESPIQSRRLLENSQSPRSVAMACSYIIKVEDSATSTGSFRRRAEHLFFSIFLFLILLASRVSSGAVSLDSSSGSFRVSCCHCLGISLVEDSLNDLLFFRAQNLREILIELWLFLLKA